MKTLALHKRHVVALCVTGVYAYLGYTEIVTDLFAMVLYVTFCNVLIFLNGRATRYEGLVGAINKNSTSKGSAIAVLEGIGWVFLFGPAVWFVFKITHVL